MTTWRLKAVRFCDFRKSAPALMEEFRADKRWQGELATGEVYLLVSLTGNQLVFVVGDSNFRGRRLVDTRRLQLSGETSWNPTMIAEYANHVGLKLQGFKMLQELFADRAEERKGERK